MQKIPMSRLIVLLMVMVCGSGCAFGHKVNYHEVVPNVDATGNGQLGVALANVVWIHLACLCKR
jgi:hypothetical protein